MKYSEIKQIIRKLKDEGYVKHKGFPHYRKIWYSGSLSYGQMISVKYLIDFRGGIDYMLNRFEEDAQRKLANAYENSKF